MNGSSSSEDKAMGDIGVRGIGPPDGPRLGVNDAEVEVMIDGGGGARFVELMLALLPALAEIRAEVDVAVKLLMVATLGVPTFGVPSASFSCIRTSLSALTHALHSSAVSA